MAEEPAQKVEVLERTFAAARNVMTPTAAEVAATKVIAMGLTAAVTTPVSTTAAVQAAVQAVAGLAARTQTARIPAALAVQARTRAA